MLKLEVLLFGCNHVTCRKKTNSSVSPSQIGEFSPYAESWLSRCFFTLTTYSLCHIHVLCICTPMQQFEILVEHKRISWYDGSSEIPWCAGCQGKMDR